MARIPAPSRDSGRKRPGVRRLPTSLRIGQRWSSGGEVYEVSQIHRVDRQVELRHTGTGVTRLESSDDLLASYRLVKGEGQ